jgi:hypothetical protein
LPAVRILLILLGAFCQAQVVTLDNGVAQAAFQLKGGSLSDFQFKDQKLNPFTWQGRPEQGEARLRGHFLCLDRWGPPSAAEARNGMPFHGEAPRVMWTGNAIDNSGVAMSAHLPLAGLHVVRRARLHPSLAVVSVTETVTNQNKLGRIYNMVQHPSIGPPFLDTTTVVDSNARKGLMQSTPLPNPEEPPVWFPMALKDGQPVNLRHLTSDAYPPVVSFVVDETYGWATVATAGRGLLLGYVWKTSEYPWLTMWRHVEDGKPAARGVEFGTTGLHQPLEVLVAKGRIFDRPLVAFLDADQSASRSWAVFLTKISADFQGVERLDYNGRRIVLAERGSGRTITIETGEIF